MRKTRNALLGILTMMSGATAAHGSDGVFTTPRSRAPRELDWSLPTEQLQQDEHPAHDPRAPHKP